MMDKYLTTEQVANILQVHPFTILKFIKNGKIRGVKLGRVYRINENDVKEFLENMTVGSRKKEKSIKIEEANIEEKITPVLEKKDDKEIFLVEEVSENKEVYII
ncbi:MAG: helix-turn-helix domain-containing protein [Candidatus Gracilibacteria bacterium]|jgi:excisionase family DNA binding protein|nr:helix-turn-helix domain-containing protein [Candidatus Gracilibacteria bacterium]